MLYDVMLNCPSESEDGEDSNEGGKAGLDESGHVASDGDFE